MFFLGTTGFLLSCLRFRDDKTLVVKVPSVKHLKKSMRPNRPNP
jgi:hypothetical protein